MKKALAVAALVLVGVVPGLARAEDSKEYNSEGGQRYQKSQSINFEDDTIEGDLTKPDGEYLEARKGVQHSNLIHIREEFKDKVMESVGEL